MVPPLAGVAVNVTPVPAQILLPDATISTEGISIGFTDIVTVFEVIVTSAAHVAFDVKIKVIASLLFNVEEVNAVELVPAFTPFICH